MCSLPTALRALTYFPQHLDISWNAVGSSANNRAAARALSHALRVHSKLVHLDLSHNQLNEECCQELGKGLAANHVLMGLHMGGNGQAVDPRGFLQKAGAREGDAAVAQSHIFTRIIG